jgi:hypothetical protein
MKGFREAPGANEDVLLFLNLEPRLLSTKVAMPSSKIFAA